MPAHKHRKIRGFRHILHGIRPKSGNALVYVITNTVTGGKYVGVTTCALEFRWSLHISHRNNAEKRDRPLYKALREFGPDAFKVETLEVVPVHTRFEAERQWIERLNTVVPNGYNWLQSEEHGARISERNLGKTTGPRGPLSEETKAKLSEALKGKTPWCKGKKHTEEHKAAMRAGWARRNGAPTAKKGRKLSPEHVAKLRHATKPLEILDAAA